MEVMPVIRETLTDNFILGLVITLLIKILLMCPSDVSNEFQQNLINIDSKNK